MDPIEDLTAKLFIWLILAPVVVGGIVAMFYEIRYRFGLRWQRDHEYRNRMMGIEK